MVCGRDNAGVTHIESILMINGPRGHVQTHKHQIEGLDAGKSHEPREKQKIKLG